MRDVVRSKTSVVVGILVLGLMATGCAGLRKEASAGNGGSPLAPKTITASVPNSTVLLHLGDTLVFRPFPDKMPPGMQWNLLVIPKQLKLKSKTGVLPFTFSVVHSGI